MTQLIFYTTAACHLCEQAAQLLAEIQQQHIVEVISVDISEDEKLVEVYGIRIPVVSNAAQDKEVSWPFELDDLLKLLD